jgi:hypothetical protein
MIKVLEYTKSISRLFELFFITFMISTAIGVAFMEASFAGAMISLLVVFVVPGWLLTNVLFGRWGSLKPEACFILTFGLGASLAALDAVFLTLIGIRISRESTTILAAAVSFLLMGALIARRGLGHWHQESALPWRVLVAAMLAIFVFCALVLFHQPVVQEAYSEFYIVPRGWDEVNGHISKADLILSSHEDRTYLFRMICKEASGSEQLLAESLIQPESSFGVELFVPPPEPGQSSRIQLVAYREGDGTPYRWVELVGGACDLLPQPLRTASDTRVEIEALRE